MFYPGEIPEEKAEVYNFGDVFVILVLVRWDSNGDDVARAGEGGGGNCVILNFAEKTSTDLLFVSDIFLPLVSNLFSSCYILKDPLPVPAKKATVLLPRQKSTVATRHQLSPHVTNCRHTVTATTLPPTATNCHQLTSTVTGSHHCHHIATNCHHCHHWHSCHHCHYYHYCHQHHCHHCHQL
jgi:hypothetical protein